jgi:hypothetical protein
MSTARRERLYLVPRARATLWGLAVVAALFLLLVAAPAHAQDAVTVDAANGAVAQAQDRGPDAGAIGTAVARAVLGGLGDWLEQWLTTGGPAIVARAFLTGLGWLGQRLLSGLAHASTGPGVDVMTRLDADLTLGDETVQTVWRAGRNAFDGLIGVGIMVTGFLVLLRFGGVTASEVGELLPRVGIGVVLVNGSLDLLRWLVTVANGAASYLAGAGALGLTNQTLAQLPPAEAGGLLLVVAVMTGLLFVQRLLLHGLLDLLAMVAPLALACWVIPAWSAWFWRWANLLGAVLAGAVFQTMLLAAGSGMLARAIARSGDGSADAQRLIAGAIAVALLGLTIGAPALVGLGAVGGTTLGIVRRLTRARQLRDNVRTPRAPSTGDGEPEPEPIQPQWEEVRYGVASQGELPARGRREPPTIIFTQLPSLPPNASGGAADRLALPPPDYLT